MRSTLPLAALGVLPIALALAPRSAQEHEEAPVDVERLFRTSCAMCHPAPDLRFAADRAWLEQVHDTAWTDTPQGAREALVELLADGGLAPPEAVVAPPGSDAEGVGFVDCNLAEGALLVSDERGRVRRLSWERVDGAEPPADRRRALPPGDYTIAGYRMVDRSGEDVWIASATKRRLGAFAVAAGETAAVEIDPTVVIRRRFTGDAVAVAVQGMGGAGLTLYRDGERIPIRYRLLGPDGRELAAGAIEYGWGGGGRASVKPVDGAELELELAEPPFAVERTGFE